MMFRMRTFYSKTRESLMRDSLEDLSVANAFDNFVSDLLRMHQERLALSEEEIHRIFHAVEFAAERHRKQIRRNKEKTPYIIHPLLVAQYLLVTGKVTDTDILMAALLHDTIEDTETSLDDLQQHFGYRVQRLVEELTDDKHLPKEERKRLQIENAASKSQEAAHIVLADKLSNLSDLLENPPPAWDLERISNYFLWAQAVIKSLPPANPFLLHAVEEVMEAYWQKLAKQEYGE